MDNLIPYRIQTHLLKLFFLLLFSMLIGTRILWSQQEITGGDISQSTIFKKSVYPVKTVLLDSLPYLTVRKDNITLDFGSATLEGRIPGQMPNAFSGVALLIKDCKDVTIRNLNIHGFKIAILAENVENLTIEDCDLSYNYRPKLLSHWNRESLSDWLYFHHNENDEWKDYGAAIYLHHCPKSIIHDVTCHQGMNGLLMVQSDNCLVYNNDFSFNSGLGIGLYRSSNNQIMHNKLDWNARGYSHGQYARGQDSAAILLYEQSSNNTIAYNSATHSGDGFFLWAGQSTMDTGKGGCDDNILYQNDFSHSIANGIEATFSSNIMMENKLNDCHYGIWAGYSHHSIIQGNEIKDCETGIAIEHGRYISMTANQIVNAKTGIKLWSREQQPEDWAYAKINRVDGSVYRIGNNHFDHVATALDILRTDSVELDGNIFNGVQRLYSTPLDSSYFVDQPDAFSTLGLHAPLPKKMMAGLDSQLPAKQLQGRKYIIVNEWGPYDFQYPLLALRKKEDVGEITWYSFDLFGPPGKWRIDSIEGFSLPENTSGSLPDSIKVFCSPDAADRYLGLSFVGDPFVTQFGDSISKNTKYSFHFSEFNLAPIWNVSFFAYDSMTDPLQYPASFTAVINGSPLKSVKSTQLAYRWWDQPFPEVPAEQFAVKATTTFKTTAGDYVLQTESDDGIRVWLDNKLILEHWDVHTPANDEVKLKITSGQHDLKVEYFEAGGLAVLDVALLKR